jgi:hypothetical protein
MKILYCLFWVNGTRIYDFVKYIYVMSWWVEMVIFRRVLSTLYDGGIAICNSIYFMQFKYFYICCIDRTDVCRCWQVCYLHTVAAMLGTARCSSWNVYTIGWRLMSVVYMMSTVLTSITFRSCIWYRLGLLDFQFLRMCHCTLES